MLKLIDIRLYVILDISLLMQLGRGAIAVMEQAFSGGADIFQLRHKGATEKTLYSEATMLVPVAKKLGVPFIVNDSLSVALASGADGVHLGEDDLPISAARQIAPQGFIIGASASSVNSAIAAEENGADYIGYGAIFPTQTKYDAQKGSIDELKKIMRSVKIPVFALGGINTENLSRLLEIGCRRVCVASGIIGTQHPNNSAQKIKNILIKA